MSHIAITKVQLKNPDPQLLKKTVAQLAKELNGSVVTEIVDYNGRKENVPLALKTPKIFRGVGILIDENGEVKFKGDFWHYQKEIQKLKKQLTQSYTSLAVQVALKKMGYKIKQQKRENKIYIFAEV